MFKITGLDKLQRDLNDAQRALKSLGGTITTLNFDPGDPASVQNAIRQMEEEVDGKVYPHDRNALVAPLVAETKKHFRDEIQKRVRKHTEAA